MASIEGLRTNLTGAFLCAKYGMQPMQHQGSGGRLIFLGSESHIRERFWAMLLMQQAKVPFIRWQKHLHARAHP